VGCLRRAHRGAAQHGSGFLKQIMPEAPFQDVVAAPDLVQGGTVLAVAVSITSFASKIPYSTSPWRFSSKKMRNTKWI